MKFTLSFLLTKLHPCQLMSWVTQMWRCRTIKSVLCIQCFTQLTPLTSNSHSIYTVDSNTKFLNYMKIWLKALSCNKLWNNSSNVNTDGFHCHFLFSVLVSKQETSNFALLGKEFNPFKGEAAVFVRTEAKITMLFHCLFWPEMLLQARTLCLVCFCYFLCNNFNM